MQAASSARNPHEHPLINWLVQAIRDFRTCPPEWQDLAEAW
jgi:hypothetical protein